ncbi:MAG TPA: polyprenol monophosphomannose synthase [Solirubrobacterales bacterium]
MGTEPPTDPLPGPTWVVIPTYNEADTIAGLVDAVRRELPDDRRVLVVDDASPDGTGEIAAALAREHDDVEVLHRREKLGLGPAYVAGFRVALDGGAARVVQMDADFSHDPQALPALLAALADADLVLGSRYVSGGDVHDWGAGRRAISRLGSKYARMALGVRVHDLTGGYKVWRRATLEEIDIEAVSATGYAFQVETTYRAIKAGFRVREVPITFRDRRIGASKMTRSIVFEAAWQVPAMRLRRHL